MCTMHANFCFWLLRQNSARVAFICYFSFLLEWRWVKCTKPGKQVSVPYVSNSEVILMLVVLILILFICLHFRLIKNLQWNQHLFSCSNSCPLFTIADPDRTIERNRTIKKQLSTRINISIFTKIIYHFSVCSCRPPAAAAARRWAKIYDEIARL